MAADDRMTALLDGTRQRLAAHERCDWSVLTRVAESIVRNGNLDTMDPESVAFYADWLAQTARRMVSKKAAVVAKPSKQPRIVHLIPWALTTGGTQRMVDLWCSRDACRWDAHVLGMGPRGPFSFSGATVHVDLTAKDVPPLVEQLAPDVFVHHNPGPWLTLTCPQVWVIHSAKNLVSKPPSYAKPAAVFVNSLPENTHPGWRDLPIRVLPLGVDLAAFRPGVPGAFQSPSSDPQSLVCGIVGRLHADKVPMEFVRALKGWRHGPWTVRFVGHGLTSGHQAKVRAAVADLSWVEFAGDVPPDKMAAAYRALDAILIPTAAEFGETGSYAAVEAMACGVPVVGRDSAGLRQNCGSAPLYATTDAGLLRRLRELEHPPLRERLAAQGRRLAEQDHDLASHVDAHSAAFAGALARDVSILMPVYDTPAAYLAECWESIRDQTFRRWELVLVDDGSTAPETVAEIDRIARDPRVRLVRLPVNQGVPRALNAGLAQCRAPLVARMDGDDIMLPDRLQSQRQYLIAHIEVAILGTQSRVIFPDGRLSKPSTRPAVFTNEVLLQQRASGLIWPLNHPTVMFRRDAVRSLGGYPTYRAGQDLALWLTAHKAGLVIHNLQSVGVHYRQHPGQINARAPATKAEYDRIVDQCCGPVVHPHPHKPNSKKRR